MTTWSKRSIGMLTEGLGVTHLRLILGTSMGCMHGFVWGETYPDFASALMPLACEPVELAGLNRMWRQLAINGIEADPAWESGEYKSQPMMGLRAAQNLLFVAGGAPLLLQAQYPTRAAAGAYAEERVANALKTLDANDLIYQLDSSRNYNPWPKLEQIKVPLMWINSADDFINPRNLTFPADALKRMSDGAVPVDCGDAGDPRPRYAYLGEVLEGRPYFASGAVELGATS